jgi:hypothetical protein
VIDSAVEVVLVSVAVSVASPVALVKNPVPPVITKSIVTMAVPWPLAVPLPEVVPNRVPGFRLVAARWDAVEIILKQ